MNKPKQKCLSLIIALVILPLAVFSQNTDSTKVVSHFGVSATINTKGISTIPNLTLGKPADIFAMSVAVVNRDFHLPVSVLLNKSIITDLPSHDDFLWNIGLIYSFNKRYIEYQ